MYKRQVLYMMTIEKLQDQERLIERQEQINIEQRQQLEELTERFTQLERLLQNR